MKKLIALALGLLLLLSGCAYPGGEAGGQLRLKELMYALGDKDVVDLSGLVADLEAGCSDSAAGARMNVTAGERQYEAVLAVVDGELTMLLNTAEGGSHAYVIGVPELNELVSGLFESLFAEEDVPADVPDGGLLFQSMDELQQMADAVPGSSVSPMEQLMDRCMTDGEPLERDGVSFDVTDIHISHEDLLELVGLALPENPEGTESAEDDIGQLLADAGLTLDISGSAAVSEETDQAALGLDFTVADAEGGVVDTYLSLQELDGDGDIDLYLEMTLDGESLGAFSIAFNISPLEQADWLPDQIPADAAVLTEESTQEELAAFGQNIADFAGQVSGAIFGMMLGNRVVDGLSQLFA